MEARNIGPGHNNPPSETDIALRMKDLYGDLLARADNLVEAEERVPGVIEDDETSGKVGDYIKQLTAAAKALDAARVGEKEPHLAAGRAVDGFFKRYTEKLKEVKERASKPHAEYIKRKEEQKRREREEEAERKRQEAEDKLREVEEKRKEAERLERERLEAEQRVKREQEAEAERLRKEREDLERQRKEQEERDRKAKEEAERKKREEAEKAERDAEAERKAKEEEAERKRKAKEDEEALRQRERDLKERERKLKRDEKESSRTIAQIQRSAKKLERESDRDLETAAKIDKQADRLDSVSIDSKLVRIRGEEGSISSTRDRWVGELTSREKLDLEKLRAHIPEDALQKAIQSFVDAGGRELSGAWIGRDTKAVVR